MKIPFFSAKRACGFALIALALGACTPEQADVWCRTHRLEDVRFSRTSVDGLTPTDRRKYLRILEEGARLCGWRPGR